MGIALTVALYKLPHEFTLNYGVSVVIYALGTYCVAACAFLQTRAIARVASLLEYDEPNHCLRMHTSAFPFRKQKMVEFPLADLANVAVAESEQLSKTVFRITLKGAGNRRATIYSADCPVVSESLRDICIANHIEYSEGRFNVLEMIWPELLHCAVAVSVIVGVTAAYPVIIK